LLKLHAAGILSHRREQKLNGGPLHLAKAVPAPQVDQEGRSSRCQPTKHGQVAKPEGQERVYVHWTFVPTRSVETTLLYAFLAG
jgi:hypothetical protein